MKPYPTFARQGALVALALSAAACGSKTTTSVDDASAVADDADAGVIATGPAPTWYQDIAPIAAGHCTGCHRTGGIGPFSLENYPDARSHAPLVAALVMDGTMPPWGAENTSECQVTAPWKDDPRLSAAQKDLIQRWAAAGAPQGDPTTAAALPTPPSLTLANPNASAKVATPYTVQGGDDQFRCFPLTFTFPDDVWITGLQVSPGNSKVVHHVLVWTDPTGQGAALAGADSSYQCFGAPGYNDASLLAAWAPGGVPIETPPNVGMAVKKGTRIVLNVHYHPTGTSTEVDATGIDLRWTTTRPDYLGQVLLIGNFSTAVKNGTGLQPDPDDRPGGVEFRVPANAMNHVETETFTVPAKIGTTRVPDLRVWATATHMHYVGTDMKISVAHASPAPGQQPSECLLQTPRWNFAWQRLYSFDEPLDQLPLLHPGDVLTMRCTYNNTLNNSYVAAALQQQGLRSPRDVLLGETTLDEMCLGGFGIAYRASDVEADAGQ